MNITWSQRLIENLYANGVREVVFCAGARNSPLVAVLDQAKGLRAYSYFEERSASFFAMGLARRTERPVAVITTSGTAAAELLPATIEAYHLGLPLILLTADRPKRLRGTGAPQAIDQTGLYTKFVELECDLESGELPQLRMWSRRAPVHINVCFDEPLLDEALSPFDLTELRGPASGNGDPLMRIRGASRTEMTASAEWASLRLTRFLGGDSQLLILVGSLECSEERAAVVRLAQKLRAPIYLEATSGLRENRELSEFALRSGDRILPWALKRGMFQKVLRIGGVPTARIWRDLEDPASPIETLSINPLPFAGLSRGEFLCAEIQTALDQVGPIEAKPVDPSWLSHDRAQCERLTALFAEFPKSEPALFHALSKLIAKDAHIYVGNSLPIREWDLAASYHEGFAKTGAVAVEANRGVNGIDGQVSSFWGGAHDDRDNWAVIGDLTAMYDLAGLWAEGQRPEPCIRLVVVNNGGGKIFSRIFKNAMFENRHSFGFEHWAKQWGLAFERWTSIPRSFEGPRHVVIELVPDEAQTKSFWDHYDS